MYFPFRKGKTSIIIRRNTIWYFPFGNAMYMNILTARYYILIWNFFANEIFKISCNAIPLNVKFHGIDFFKSWL